MYYILKIKKIVNKTLTFEQLWWGFFGGGELALFKTPVLAKMKNRWMVNLELKISTTKIIKCFCEYSPNFRAGTKNNHNIQKSQVLGCHGTLLALLMKNFHPMPFDPAWAPQHSKMHPCKKNKIKIKKINK